jgi:hypothetical protein
MFAHPTGKLISSPKTSLIGDWRGSAKRSSRACGAANGSASAMDCTSWAAHHSSTSVGCCARLSVKVQSVHEYTEISAVKQDFAELVRSNFTRIWCKRSRTRACRTLARCNLAADATCVSQVHRQAAFAAEGAASVRARLRSSRFSGTRCLRRFHIPHGHEQRRHDHHQRHGKHCLIIERFDQ